MRYYRSVDVNHIGIFLPWTVLWAFPKGPAVACAISFIPIEPVERASTTGGYCQNSEAFWIAVPAARC